jgi:hypothetical protein
MGTKLRRRREEEERRYWASKMALELFRTILTIVVLLSSGHFL